MRRLATFALWLGLFGLFLAFAAFSVGDNQTQLAIGSAASVFLAWVVLRKPARPYHPENRFKTLRKLGVVGKGRSHNNEEK
jgi:hypothetical protein